MSSYGGVGTTKCCRERKVYRWFPLVYWPVSKPGLTRGPRSKGSLLRLSLRSSARSRRERGSGCVGDRRFGVFVFVDAASRDAHLAQFGESVRAKGLELFTAAPGVEPVEIVSAKVPA